MDKHIQLAGILNLAYRALVLGLSFVLFIIAAGFSQFCRFLMRTGSLDMRDVPFELLDLIPLILVLVGVLMFIVSAVAIVGSVGLMKRKEWARILMMVISFFNLLRIPLGTVLGVYTLWVLMNDETIKIFNPAAVVKK
ncbi:MAG TPA: hypothetical protein VL126_12165 [Bacteroidota bacterium]|nr:hypothetical protein [Bacteroidota bacterium]